MVDTESSGLIKPIERPGLLRVYAWMIYLSWALLWAAALLLIPTFLFQWPVVSVFLIGAFLLLVPLVVPLSLFFKCPHCGRLATWETFAPVHPNAAERDHGWRQGWKRVIFDAARGEDFVCIRCGEWVGLRTRRSGRADTA